VLRDAPVADVSVVVVVVVVVSLVPEALVPVVELVLLGIALDDDGVSVVVPVALEVPAALVGLVMPLLVVPCGVAVLEGPALLGVPEVPESGVPVAVPVEPAPAPVLDGSVPCPPAPVPCAWAMPKAPAREAQAAAMASCLKNVMSGLLLARWLRFRATR
jgi:hypothetical protein